jgi:hypothetical protein
MNEEMLSEQNQGFFSKLLRIVKSEYWLYPPIDLESPLFGFYIM